MFRPPQVVRDLSQLTNNLRQADYVGACSEVNKEPLGGDEKAIIVCVCGIRGYTNADDCERATSR